MNPTFRLLSGRVTRSTSNSAGWDLYYTGDLPFVLTDRVEAVPTGVRSSFSPDIVAVIKERSGRALEGVEVHGGVIDSDYRDLEWKVLMRFPGHEEMGVGSHGHLIRRRLSQFVIQPGDRIAQFLLVPVPAVQIEVEGDAVVEVKDTVRAGGLGSTGA